LALHDPADVAADRGRVNQASGRDHGSDADVLRQVNVGQNDDVPHILGLAQTLC
jgi:hypothetical protein